MANLVGDFDWATITIILNLLRLIIFIYLAKFSTN